MASSGGGSGAPPGDGSQPPVRLPFAATQGDTLPPVAPAAAAAEADLFGEDDLFGSDPEPEAPSAASSGAAATAAAAAKAAAAAAASAPAGRGPVETEDLFGSEPGDDLDERALFGSDDEGGELDERALFGSDDEDEAQKKPDGERSPPRSPAMSDLMSEMDEREIFGEVSEDEPEQVEDVVIRRRPAPGTDRQFVTMRLPNVLSIERTAFNPEQIPQTLLEGFKGYENTLNKTVMRLLNAENCVRWRFKKGPDGHILTDDEGRPQYETNSRIVEWEDGSKTLYVGSEAFDITEIEDRIILFEENSQDVHVCHGTASTRFVVTPRDLDSTTHEMLKRTQFHKFEAIRRSLLMSQEEQDAHQALLQIQADQRERQRKDDQRKRALEASGEAAVMSRAFLEDLEDSGGGVGPSVKDMKDDAKRQRVA